MAQNGSSQQPNVHVNVHLIQQRDNVRVHGNQVRKESTTTTIAAEEIGQVVVPASGTSEEHQGGQAVDNDPQEEDVGHVQGDPVAPNNASRSMEKMSLGRKDNKSVQTENLKQWTFILEAKSRLHLAKSEFAEAVELLEKLVPFQKEDPTSTQLMLAGCYLHLTRREDAKNIINDITEKMMTSPRPKIDDIMEIADSYQERLPIRALILRHCLSKLFKLDKSLSDACRGIRSKCVFKSSFIIRTMAKVKGRKRSIASYLIYLLHDMLEDLRSVKGGSSDVTFEAECHCLNEIGRSYNAVGEYQKAMDIYKEGVRIMQKHFKSNASKYQVLGHFLNNIGLANKKCAEYAEAKKFFLEALKAYDNVTDWTDEDEKRKSIESTKTNLKNARDAMKK